MNYDKWLHLSISAIITFIMWLVYDDLFTAAYATLSIGIMKELFDSITGGNADWWDLVADMGGILIAAILIKVVS